MKISILMCPAHNYMAVAMNDTRITPSKCCGSWKTLREWDVTAEKLAGSLKSAGMSLAREKLLEIFEAK